MKHINMWEIIKQNDGEGQRGSYPGTNLEYRSLCLSDCNNSIGNSNSDNNENGNGNKNSNNNSNNNDNNNLCL